MIRAPVLGLLLALAAAGIVCAGVEVGEVRVAQARDGVPLREAPKGLAKVLEVVPYGTRVTVQELQGFYVKVSVSSTGSAGWVRLADVVEPPVLTGRGVPRVGGGAAAASTADVSAAGRQFDDATEGEYKASSAEIGHAYDLIDALEKKTPTDAEVEAFVRDGKLGR